jgi:hypothetical protein
MRGPACCASHARSSEVYHPPRLHDSVQIVIEMLLEMACTSVHAMSSAPIAADTERPKPSESTSRMRDG